ncbi:MAG: recombinase family protein, partial [Nanoarchaeota archaeon]
MRAVGYIRVSQEERKKKNRDDLETSLQNQRKDIEDYCKNKDFELIEIYDDKYLSGDDPDRPELKRMQADMYASKFDII